MGDRYKTIKEKQSQWKKVYKNSECEVCNNGLVEVRLLDGVIICKDCYREKNGTNKENIIQKV